MKGVFAFMLCLSVANCAFLKFDEYQEQWQAWKTFHGKKYETDTEEEARYAIWRDNLRKIQQHNSEGHSYTLAMNQFGDLTVDEYRFFFLGLRSHIANEKEQQVSSFLPPSGVTLPDTVDWTAKGYVTPIKDQGHCGSCYAFSTTGSLEGQHFKKTGQLVSLSEQNLVDCSCSLKYGNFGCVGGFVDKTFKYIKDNGGINTEASYPYKAKLGSCHFNKTHVGATVTGYMDIEKGNESALQFAVATVGPISVGIDASHHSFRFYHKGVYNEPACSRTWLNHAVLVVGYGTYLGQGYWLVKNSWGTRWGKKGYIMMSRNKKNQCGIASTASYPLV